MIEIKINNEQFKRAEKLYEFKELKGSITKGESNIYGAVGEIVVNDYYLNKGVNVDFTSTFDYDLIIDNYKVDVKTKKYTSKFKPNMKWNLNISDYNTTQKCDFYFFIGVSDDFSNAFLYGYIDNKTFYAKAIFNKKNKIDPNGNGLWRFKDDCYNLPISSLEKLK
tara:strand:+ start:66 stop:563 length:498 start_codon:yes stop_codon:yes gene_type:complete